MVSLVGERSTIPFPWSVLDLNQSSPATYTKRNPPITIKNILDFENSEIRYWVLGTLRVWEPWTVDRVSTCRQKPTVKLSQTTTSAVAKVLHLPAKERTAATVSTEQSEHPNQPQAKHSVWFVTTWLPSWADTPARRSVNAHKVLSLPQFEIMNLYFQNFQSSKYF